MIMPEYVGPAAFGIKMGVILPGCKLENMIHDVLCRCSEDNLLNDGDAVCITESVVARAQNNYVTTDEVARQIKELLGLNKDGEIGVVFPITSRNRFALILSGIAKVVPQGRVIVQFSYPCDEVGNRILPKDFIESLGKGLDDIITYEELDGRKFAHPLTNVNYIELYREIIKKEGAQPVVFFSNNPRDITKYNPHGTIVSDIHSRHETYRKIKEVMNNCITLQDICSSGTYWSEWGLLGSNMSSGNRLKLAPREGSKVAQRIKDRVARELNKNIEVIIYGDGAYKDPSSGIYELADPQPVFGATDGLNGKLREGIKYKYFVDLYTDEGKTQEEIEAILEEKKKEAVVQNSIGAGGTTPRRMEDLLASLADLVSGSADAGTPLILVRGYLT